MQQETVMLPRASCQRLLDVLAEAGYQCLGPTARDGTIVYDRLTSIEQLPVGIRDHQAPGEYRLESGAAPRWFAWANGPQALKPLVFSPHEVLWRAQQNQQGLTFEAHRPEPPLTAVIGVRACDLAALKIHDQHFLGGDYPDPNYQALREALFLVAVNCTAPAATCFCASTGDGPRAAAGYDLAIDELDEGLLLAAATDRGRVILAALPTQAASRAQLETAADETERAARAQSRGLDGEAARTGIGALLDDSIWDEVSKTCLSCGNCTSVCPTCFCYSEHDEGGLELQSSEHVRQWASCFQRTHSYIHGMTFRKKTKHRYRQWVVHKLQTWHEQFGRSGCVGCGRCITWCPVGIDITEVAQKIARKAAP